MINPVTSLYTLDTVVIEINGSCKIYFS